VASRLGLTEADRVGVKTPFIWVSVGSGEGTTTSQFTWRRGWRRKYVQPLSGFFSSVAAPVVRDSISALAHHNYVYDGQALSLWTTSPLFVGPQRSILYKTGTGKDPPKQQSREDILVHYAAYWYNILPSMSLCRSGGRGRLEKAGKGVQNGQSPLACSNCSKFPWESCASCMEFRFFSKTTLRAL